MSFCNYKSYHSCHKASLGGVLWFVCNTCAGCECVSNCALLLFAILITWILVLILTTLSAVLGYIPQSVFSNILFMLRWFLNTKHSPQLIKASWTKSLLRVIIPAQLKFDWMKDGTYTVLHRGCLPFPSACFLYNHTPSRPDSKCSIICHEEISPNGKVLVAMDY